jgi:hypothetical protein
MQAPAARTLRAAILALALLAASTPFNSLALTHFCSMPCCAGKPLHSAGSCTGNSCHAHLARKKTPAPDELCGGHAHMAHGTLLHNQGASHIAQTSYDFADEAQQHTPTQTVSVASSFLTKPCPADCGASVGGGAQVRRTRDSAALSHAAQPRPPTRVRLASRSDHMRPALSALRKQARPRAPPLISCG